MARLGFVSPNIQNQPNLTPNQNTARALSSEVMQVNYFILLFSSSLCMTL